MIKDGGAAFPYQPGDWAVDNTGMTLRDWFAGKAMQGLLSNQSLIDTIDKSNCMWISDWAYKQADSMIAQREKEADNG